MSNHVQIGVSVIAKDTPSSGSVLKQPSRMSQVTAVPGWSSGKQIQILSPEDTRQLCRQIHPAMNTLGSIRIYGHLLDHGNLFPKTGCNMSPSLGS